LRGELIVIATKDFRYYDFAQKRSIQVEAGQSLDADTLGRNKVDVEKLHRTKFLDRGEGATDLKPRKRSRKA
jgi:hypothetical protein